MSYIVLFMTGTILAMLFHFRHQLRKTAHIRQSLQEARNSRTLVGLHDLRKKEH